MTLQQSLLDKLKQLPTHKQQELLDFADFLCRQNLFQPSGKSIKGICSDLSFDLTEEELQKARREIWSNFPREDLF